MNKLATTGSTLLGNLRGTGPLGLESNTAQEAPDIFNRIISITVGVMTMIASIWFLFIIISGAYAWISAGGDKVAIENARKRILNGTIGIVIVIAAIFILDLVGTLLNFPFITNPGELIRNISP